MVSATDNTPHGRSSRQTILFFLSRSSPPPPDSPLALLLDRPLFQRRPSHRWCAFARSWFFFRFYRPSQTRRRLDFDFIRFVFSLRVRRRHASISSVGARCVTTSIFKRVSSIIGFYPVVSYFIPLPCAAAVGGGKTTGENKTFSRRL